MDFVLPRMLFTARVMEERREKKRLLTVAKKTSLQILPSTKHNCAHLAFINLCLQTIKTFFVFDFYPSAICMRPQVWHIVFFKQCLAQHMWCLDFTFSLFLQTASFSDMGEAYTFLLLAVLFVPFLVFDAFRLFGLSFAIVAWKPSHVQASKLP